MTERRDAVVVGAGMGGLTAAHALAAAGLRPLVLEAGDRVGGLVQHARVGGIDVDAGAESFALRRPEVADLVGRLGLERATPASDSTIWLPDGGGRALTTPARSLLGIPADPLADDVVAVVGRDAAARAAADLTLDPAAGADSATLAELVTVRMGADLLERLVRPVARGIHGADPENLAVDAVAPGLRAALVTHGSLAAAVGATVGDGPAVACVVGGMWRLPEALAASAEVHTGTRVTSVVREPDGTWSVHADDGAAPVRTRRLVLAVPGPETVELLSGALPGEVPELRPGHPIVQVTLVLDAPELDAAPLGSGVLVGPDAGVRTKALTHATAKWAWLRAAVPQGVHVLRLSYGRAGDDPAAIEAVDAEVARADAQALLGVPLAPAQVLDSLRVRRPLGLPPSAAADPALRPLLERVRAASGLGVCGAWVAGTGVAAVVAQAEQEARRLLDAPAAGDHATPGDASPLLAVHPPILD
ncbi:oxygen-dependent protoporphyrinogen oxidase [Georgenia satyanarayanai]|uniref:Oxygen-dependent protoporphyrinogen oxidase n=1 Tax=Georgenia satyanarayanai TaxID=860221 RepID=A0A2Y9C7D0_9MICO|nr:FAD-dependent oxidoreductase [Georgenia satyanarayanai]PYF98278.1 oxygen-dependent protoporphyrinogen oxidase [Georgenia satyanarayanai]SSA45163.1 oxygen-dependent protoporphyrinogen oxidase [Georgenia satyanarayanai]